jgi:hypothetical protein
LPIPPAPVSVTSREPPRTSAASSDSSASRPTSGVSGHERLVPHVLVRRPAPQLERLAQRRRRRLALAIAQLRPAAGHQQLEPLEIQLPGLAPEPVSRALACDPLRPEPPAQRVHLDLEGVGGRRGRLLAPQRVDQPVARGDLVTGDQELREKRDLPARRELDRTRSGDDLHGAQNAEIHFVLVQPTRSYICAYSWL